MLSSSALGIIVMDSSLAFPKRP